MAVVEAVACEPPPAEAEDVQVNCFTTKKLGRGPKRRVVGEMMLLATFGCRRPDLDVGAKQIPFQILECGHVVAKSRQVRKRKRDHQHCAQCWRGGPPWKS